MRRRLPPADAEHDPLDHQDVLASLKARVSGLRCAINGASIANDFDRQGLQQLVEDIWDDVHSLSYVDGREC
jgi:hypothetical protein